MVTSTTVSEKITDCKRGLTEVLLLLLFFFFNLNSTSQYLVHHYFQILLLIFKMDSKHSFYNVFSSSVTIFTVCFLSYQNQVDNSFLAYTSWLTKGKPADPPKDRVVAWSCSISYLQISQKQILKSKKGKTDIKINQSYYNFMPNMLMYLIWPLIRCENV